MGEVQPAAPREQEFAPERRHSLENRDICAAPGEHFRGHKACRTAPDDRNLKTPSH
jgi:hypothetical protein